MIKHLVTASLVVASLCAGAATPTAGNAPEVAARLAALYPRTRITAVNTTEVSGLYEVVMESNTAYTDRQGRYFVFGHLYDMREQRDLTSERPEPVRKLTFPQALLANAIKVVKGNGSRIFAVFSDPECEYCRRLEKELATLTDVTIYKFLYPLESLHPSAKSKAIAIWCAPDPAKAWADALLAGTTPQLRACPNPVNDNLVLGGALGVAGTPTMIAADGRVLPGAVSAATLDAWLGPVSSARGTP